MFYAITFGTCSLFVNANIFFFKEKKKTMSMSFSTYGLVTNNEINKQYNSA